jgi:hypothetical protein
MTLNEDDIIEGGGYDKRIKNDWAVKDNSEQCAEEPGTMTACESGRLNILN